MTIYLPQKRFFKIIATITILSSLLILNGCRSKDNAMEANADDISQDHAYEKSPLALGQSHLLDSQVDSAAEWQSWHKDLFRQADNERRVVFAIIGSGTDPNMLKALNDIKKSEPLTKLLRNNHINTVIDTNLHPDIEYYMALISINSKMQIDTPMLAWFSYEGNLVSWTSITADSVSNIPSLIQRTSSTVQNLWLESPEYTLEHSRRDHRARSKISIPKPIEATEDDTPSIIGPISRVRSLFDPVSDTVDNLNNLTAARYINLLVMASNLPEQSAHQRLQCLNTAARVADKMIIHGLMDPLDGGVYSGYQSLGRTLPVFAKTLRAQAFSMSALYQLYQTTRDTKYLNAANRIAAFTSKHLTQDDGSLAIGITHSSDTPQSQREFWTSGEIKSLLTAEEFDIAIDAFGINELGNIHLSDDPQKIYFRKNILTWKTTLEDLAKSKSISTDALSQSLDSITSKLLAARSQKPNNVVIEKLSTSGSLATYTSACIAGYRASAATSLLETAEKTLSYLRDHFIDPDGQLQRASYNSQTNGIPANAADYALVCQAALDLNEATLNPEWLKFAYHIHTQMNKELRDPKTGLIKEFSGKGYPRAYPTYCFYNIKSIDNDNTWALANSNAKRLALQIDDDALTKQATQLDGIMHQTMKTSALASIDYLTRESIGRSARIYLKQPMDANMLATLRKKPCQLIAVDNSGKYPELGIEPSDMKAGTCVLFVGGERIGQASTQKELESLLSPKL
jgi:uncharacterized protein YyaL (SSP411 family)